MPTYLASVERVTSATAMLYIEAENSSQAGIIAQDKASKEKLYKDRETRHYINKVVPAKEYLVETTRTTRATQTFTVLGMNEDEVKREALYRAGDFLYTDRDHTYSVTSITEKK